MNSLYAPTNGMAMSSATTNTWFARPHFLPLIFLLFPVFLVAQPTITLTTSPNLELDSNMPGSEGPTAAYIGFCIDNTGANSYAGLTATLTLTGAGFALAGGQVATQEVGTSGNFTPGQKESLYWFISYPTTFNTAVTATIQLNDVNGPVGSPFPATITTRSTISANAGGLIASTILGPGVFVGQLLYYDVAYTFGNIKNGDYVNMQPAGNPSFDAGCYQLIDAEILASMIPGINVGDRDRIYYSATADKNGSGIPVTVRYHFFVKCAYSGATTALPYAATLSGTQFKYSGNYGDQNVMIPDPQPSFSISKSVTPNNIPDPAATLPDIVTYTVKVTNTSTQHISIQRITDMLPVSTPAFQFQNIVAGSDVTASNSASIPPMGATGTLLFVSNDLPADATIDANYFIPVGGFIELIYNVNIQAGTPHPAAYINTATATSGNYTSPPANAVVTLGNLQVSDLELNKTVSTLTPNFGDNVTYTLTVTNTGADPATGVQVLDSIPNGLMLVSAMPNFSSSIVDGNFTKYFWDNLSVPVNGSVTITYTATVVQGSGLTYKNYAEINDADQPDPDANHGWGHNADDLNDGMPDDDEDCIEISPCIPNTINASQLAVVNACPGAAVEVVLSDLPVTFPSPAIFQYELVPTAGPNIIAATGLITVVGNTASFFIPGLAVGSYTLTTLTVIASGGCTTTTGGLNVMFNVSDTEPPVITCPADLEVNCIALIPPVDFDELIVSDNCNTISTEHVGDVQLGGACPNRYTINRTFKATDGVNLMATCTQVITVDDHNLKNGSADQTLCSGAANISVQTDCDEDNDIRFVRFTTPQANPYTAVGGTVLEVVTPTGSGSPYTAAYTWNPALWTNAGTYYVYAILDQDQGLGCRPFEEIVITIINSPDLVLTTNTMAICQGASFDLVNFIASTGGGIISYHPTYQDAINDTNALSSSTVTPTTATHYYIRSETVGSSQCAEVEEVTLTFQPPTCGVITITGPN